LMTNPPLVRLRETLREKWEKRKEAARMSEAIVRWRREGCPHERSDCGLPAGEAVHMTRARSMYRRSRKYTCGAPLSCGQARGSSIARQGRLVKYALTPVNRFTIPQRLRMCFPMLRPCGIMNILTGAGRRLTGSGDRSTRRAMSVKTKKINALRVERCVD
jgi:hypothetical protein